MARRDRLTWPNFVTAREPVRTCQWHGRVRFRDCDPMGVLWHGAYLGLCEEARHALGERIGLSLTRFMAAGLFAPVVRSQVVHYLPLRAEEPVRVDVSLFPCDQARLYHRYRLWSGDTCHADGETEQVLTRSDFTMLLQWPDDLCWVLEPTRPANGDQGPTG